MRDLGWIISDEQLAAYRHSYKACYDVLPGPAQEKLFLSFDSGLQEETLEFLNTHAATPAEKEVADGNAEIR